MEPRLIRKGKAYGRRSVPDMQSLEVVPTESSILNDARYDVNQLLLCVHGKSKKNMSVYLPQN